MRPSWLLSLSSLTIILQVSKAVGSSYLIHLVSSVVVDDSCRWFWKGLDSLPRKTNWKRSCEEEFTPAVSLNPGSWLEYHPFCADLFFHSSAFFLFKISRLWGIRTHDTHNIAFLFLRLESVRTNPTWSVYASSEVVWRLVLYSSKKNIRSHQKQRERLERQQDRFWYVLVIGIFLLLVSAVFRSNTGTTRRCSQRIKSTWSSLWI